MISALVRTLLPAVLIASVAAETGILTPKPGPVPKLNTPAVYGARPGSPFLYRIPCTGDRPMRFAASPLPRTLKLDPATGIITGVTPAAGTYALTLRAENRAGRASKVWKIVAGDQIALTPPMGWNDWYTHYDRISDPLMRQAADAMVASGMADFGYSYVNIDDCWMRKTGEEIRDGAGAILANGKFPDMRALTDYIHSKGLKAGIYTSPGPLTCADYTGSYQHEEQDARTFAAWGFDFLKYDWCSYGKIAKGTTTADRRKPYDEMGAILRKLDRDVVFNLCQYGMSNVWEWGADAGGHAWRTTGDLGLEKSTRLPGFYSIAFKNAEHFAFAGPGRWNDPDYILIGMIGNARDFRQPPRHCGLTEDEQYSYMSLWALMASPLIYSGDMGALDEFTLNVLCNAEVIAIDQDELGKQARIVRRTEDEYVLARPLAGGAVALGLFNLSEAPREISVEWKELELAEDDRRAVRDVWRQKDTGTASGMYSSQVERHGVKLVTLSRSR